MPGFVRPLSLGFTLGLTLVGIGLIVAASQMAWFLVVLVIVFEAAIIWTVFRILFRRAYALELRGDWLSWSAPLLSGEFRTDELTTVRAARMGSGIWVLDRDNSYGISIPVRKGFRAFLLEIQAVRPDLTVDLDAWSLSRAESRSGSSGFLQEQSGNDGT
jgi:hypothetical protein